eukprot:649098-Pyramimonas_sp.AAC.1
MAILTDKSVLARAFGFTWASTVVRRVFPQALPLRRVSPRALPSRRSPWNPLIGRSWAPCAAGAGARMPARVAPPA